MVNFRLPGKNRKDKRKSIDEEELEDDAEDEEEGGDRCLYIYF